MLFCSILFFKDFNWIDMNILVKPYIINDMDANITIKVSPNAGLIININENNIPIIANANIHPQPLTFCRSKSQAVPTE